MAKIFRISIPIRHGKKPDYRSKRWFSLSCLGASYYQILSDVTVKCSFCRFLIRNVTFNEQLQIYGNNSQRSISTNKEWMQNHMIIVSWKILIKKVGFRKYANEQTEQHQLKSNKSQIIQFDSWKRNIVRKETPWCIRAFTGRKVASDI